MATKYEVDMLKDQIRRLIAVNDARYEMYCDTMAKVHDSQEEVRTLRATIDGLEWQIDELRRLCADIFDCAVRGAYCEKCAENNDGYACVQRMRELGVEVRDA